MNIRFCISIAFFCILVMCTNTSARTWYIKPDGSGDAPSIQAGVDSSVARDTVLVSPGTYVDSVSIQNGGETKNAVVHLYKDICLIAEGAAYNTVLDYTNNDYGVYISNTHSAVLRGFVVHLDRDWIGSRPGRNAGIFCSSGALIENNRVGSDNYGIAIRIEGGSLEQKILRGNQLLFNWLGVSVSAPNTVVEHNTIICGTVSEYGIGISFSTASATNILIQNNIIIWASTAIGCPSVCDEDAYTIRCNALHETVLDRAQLSVSLPLDSTNFAIPLGDPQFCGPGAGNYFLQSDSPCAPGNHPNGYDCGYIGSLPVGCDEVEVKKESWGGIKALYE